MRPLIFPIQPSIDERQIKELCTLAFVGDAANIVLLGPPGVGKMHLSVALALKAIDAGHGPTSCARMSSSKISTGLRSSTAWIGGCGSTSRPRSW